jgi:hypothetical protein
VKLVALYDGRTSSLFLRRSGDLVSSPTLAFRPADLNPGSWVLPCACRNTAQVSEWAHCGHAVFRVAVLVEWVSPLYLPLELFSQFSLPIQATRITNSAIQLIWKSIQSLSHSFHKQVPSPTQRASNAHDRKHRSPNPISPRNLLHHHWHPSAQIRPRARIPLTRPSRPHLQNWRLLRYQICANHAQRRNLLPRTAIPIKAIPVPAIAASVRQRGCVCRADAALRGGDAGALEQRDELRRGDRSELDGEGEPAGEVAFK